jgi:hypothetical protein
MNKTAARDAELWMRYVTEGEDIARKADKMVSEGFANFSKDDIQKLDEGAAHIDKCNDLSAKLRAVAEEVSKKEYYSFTLIRKGNGLAHLLHTAVCSANHYLLKNEKGPKVVHPDEIGV